MEIVSKQDKKNVIQLIIFKEMKVREYTKVQSDIKKISDVYFDDLNKNRYEMAKLELKEELLLSAINKINGDIQFYFNLFKADIKKNLH